MMKYVAIAALAASLATSGHAAVKGLDGYEFPKGAVAAASVELEIVEYATKKEVREALRAASEAKGVKMRMEQRKDVFGWSEIYPNSNKCRMHILSPSVAWLPEQLGHEIAHCIYKQWHK